MTLVKGKEEAKKHTTSEHGAFEFRFPRNFGQRFLQQSRVGDATTEERESELA